MKTSYLTARYTNSDVLKQTEPAIASEFDVSIYPNPNSGEFVVGLSAPLNENAKITVLNLLGQVVFADKLSSQENQMRQSVSLSHDLPDGIYYVNIKSRDLGITKQFVMQR